MSSYLKMLKSTLDYAKDKRINVMEWANFVNSLQENAQRNQAITDAKETRNQRKSSIPDYHPSLVSHSQTGTT